MYSSITRTCTFVLISLSVLYASTSCSDNKEPETGPVHEKELKEYANLTYTCGETLINVLDDIFQANMYIQADGDTELQQDIVRKYFPVAELDYDETAGMIYVNKRRSMSFDITTGGAALDKTGTVWQVKGTRSRPWPDYTPEDFELTLTCVSENRFRVSGSIISNRLFEEMFIYSEMEAEFTTGIAHTLFYETIDYGSAEEIRDMTSYKFEGTMDSYMGVSGIRNESAPAFLCTMKSLYGYNNMTYIGSEPVYDERRFFSSGDIACTFTSADGAVTQMDISVLADTCWSLTSDNMGSLESYRPGFYFYLTDSALSPAR